MRTDAILGRMALVAMIFMSPTTPADADEPAAPELPLHLNCVAVDTNGRTNAGRLFVTIERWTTDDERQRLIDALVEKGTEHLMDEVDKIKPRAGYLKTSRSLGWDIQFARATPLPDGGWRIVFATDRPMSFYELRNQTRSRDYDFMLAEIRLNREGKGQGKLATAAKVSFDRESGTLEIENYGMQPTRLTQVVIDKPNAKDDK